MRVNNYNRLAHPYQETNVKPDKQYSILPTVLSLVRSPEGRTVLDVACGGGFFTFPIAQLGVRHVIGVDNSNEQLALATTRLLPNTEFRYLDVFRHDLPAADVVVVPFVANYAASEEQLQLLFHKLHTCLNEGGHAVFVFDLPGSGKHNIPYRQRVRWGAVKWWTQHQGCDGATIVNKLFNLGRKQVCDLHAYYYRPMTIQFALQNAGFSDIRWHKPIVSVAGIVRFGEDFWHLYPENCDLGYVTANK